ncbi:MAG: class I SAM-dependent methyltransferase, partial [Planctomycetota bacterium]
PRGGGGGGGAGLQCTPSPTLPLRGREFRSMTIPWTCPMVDGIPDASDHFDERTRTQAALHDAKGAGRINPWPGVPVTLMQAQRERWLKALRLTPLGAGADPRVGPPLVLEIGCHRSGVLETFARVGWSVAGVDVSRASIVEQHMRHPGCFAVAPAEHIPLPDASVDVVLAIHVLEHVSDRAKALAEVARVLKPGGLAFLEVPLKDPGFSWDGWQRWVDQEAWERGAAGAGHEMVRLPVSKVLLGELLAAGLSIQKVERGWRWMGPLLDRLLQAVVRVQSSFPRTRESILKPPTPPSPQEGEGCQKSGTNLVRRIIGVFLRLLDILEHRLIPGTHGGTLLVLAAKPSGVVA